MSWESIMEERRRIRRRVITLFTVIGLLILSWFVACAVLLYSYGSDSPAAERRGDE